ncbi:ribose-5-phosphate isomerase RpiA [Listeria cossartiae subsp. cayugensis]|uniref:Ribose-5-phosphate isomerase A n=1 Tax=Listeria cossartiae subsp. cayugensis TaxID=2713505 RepID=A0ABU2ILP5_9LIST|nr:ribose-5-phosphate isomerase RpiA [Listeria cossartiae]MDT0048800.1 ribose-5-phosphate isomerase RpiA [Listeria cossartiae subsp. cayugensis]MDT0065303.1 ribose-5-phosphate isomerase RpiA [Listeria cossartiae subsp. cayugensis]MDT0079093.1 ribose-5-phosphate isomerase RpiA [Listeria cossartiae subsp. cayugensis]MDT0081929.1 ribose-5-phosphate isomerase RpiA [Listeria cossartiae subsp. cayugensis]MDT0087536.1 ribose-5-phosphate isomerase RpiA [Listeria cossartiae subsp. cayugensis]
MNQKKIAGEKACEWVKDGMIVGLGTGSTVYYTIEKLGDMVAQGLQITGVATSEETAKQAEKLGIPLKSLNDVTEIDVTIDGADEVDADFQGIKGGGGALLREKMVANASLKNIWVVSEEKLVRNLGAFPLPLEVIPFGWKQIQRELEKDDIETNLRKQSSGEVYVTNNGNYILDIVNQTFTDTAMWQEKLAQIPGVVEHGLFLDYVDLIICGKANGEIELIKK